jgi:glycosyltransferase involved in cell wall biosynthesis
MDSTSLLLRSAGRLLRDPVDASDVHVVVRTHTGACSCVRRPPGRLRGCPLDKPFRPFPTTVCGLGAREESMQSRDRTGGGDVGFAGPGLANGGEKKGWVAGFEAFEGTFDNAPDLVCLSHLRWNFVYQRPQHLMTRCARERRVFFFEEPIVRGDASPRLDLSLAPGGVCVALPSIPEGLTYEETMALQKEFIDELFTRCGIHDSILWYYTPMAIPFTRHLRPLATVYDCMDELSAFRGAPAGLRENERELLSRADLVFTGGLSLYEAKRSHHANVHAFPSSIDVEHFSSARQPQRDPDDQAAIPHPRLGFAGVIDERMDLELIAATARARPGWHLVMLGPVVKIDPADLPALPNIHYLGPKKYEELPAYMAGWDVALLPFARNESTRYISPTKTPEYLAAGKPVVSTSIRDVVRTYGDGGLIQVADTAEELIAAVQNCIDDFSDHSSWLARVDAVLSGNSWGRTWGRMMSLLESAIGARGSFKRAATQPRTGAVPTAGFPDLHLASASLARSEQEES